MEHFTAASSNFVPAAFEDSSGYISPSALDEEQKEEEEAAMDVPEVPAAPAFSNQRARRFPGDEESLETRQHQKTYGIGASLLMKMGFKPGGGLGAEGTGIVKPIEVTVWEKLKGLGNESEDTRHRSALGKRSPPLPEPRSQTAGKIKVKSWKKNRSVELDFKALSDVFEEREEPLGAPSHIVDMTGAEPRNIEPFDLRTKAVGEDSVLLELRHNLAALVADCQEQALGLEKEQGKLQVRREHVAESTSTLCQRAEKEAYELNFLTQAMNWVEPSKNADSFMDDSTLFDCISCAYEQLLPEAVRRLPVSSNEKSDFLAAADAFGKRGQQNLATVPDDIWHALLDHATSLLAVLLRRQIVDWDPHSESSLCLLLFRQWKRILYDPVVDDIETDDFVNARLNRSSERTMVGFEALLSQIWLPAVRRHLLQWHVRESEGVITLIEVWRDVLPPWMLRHLLSSYVYPKLEQEVLEWDPTTDTTPIHQWLHPWLPLLGDGCLNVGLDDVGSNSNLNPALGIGVQGGLLSPLYVSIRAKFVKCLVAWHPEDRSANALLLPWRTVFGRSHMDAVLTRSILPKLSHHLETQFVVSPENQCLSKYFEPNVCSVKMLIAT